LPEFRPPVFVGNLPCPESPDSSPEKPKQTTDALVESPAKGSDTCDVRTLQRQVAQLETEKAGVEDQLRRALQKIKAQEETINELRSRLGGAEETSTD
jgi:septal ring factor EnvC (AmiA/AmiB activator)